ncbi:type I-F CRISPR-associated endoribonuclease Cas6/Csy4 [Phytopseudomonas daroniae]|uniref:type I-F CRISPR-associated endoribonuclease Cas6/Csy4 n=1 Tax=Phytopseudomonas daroniae TaxID=2487519 RepID=UPI001038392B|nr:type I-F CRISPR-associated endoribonuclease Cas6/Csy4 [Pseudomonas daroniae]TBU71481.1 hypothetical protein DNK10_23890 [Pseudomonas daroniae]
MRSLPFLSCLYGSEASGRSCPSRTAFLSCLYGSEVTLRSHGNGNSFRLFIRHGPLLDAPTHGPLSSYGLSAQVSIPWF